MNKFLSFLLVLALTLCSANAQRTYVLVTGVSRYQNQDNNLQQATKDAKAFKAVMEQHTKDVTILTSMYANHSNILAKLRAICNRATSQDRIVFYFSGHGFPGGIVAYDKAIYYQEITQLLASSAAKDKIVYVDACHAGSVANKNATGSYDVVKSAAINSNMIFFMSCRGDEYSRESAWIGKGYFTKSLLKGLRGKADVDGDKAITVIELFNYIYKDVLNSTQDRPQHPQLIAPKSCHNHVLLQW